MSLNFWFIFSIILFLIEIITPGIFFIIPSIISFLIGMLSFLIKNLLFEIIFFIIGNVIVIYLLYKFKILFNNDYKGFKEKYLNKNAIVVKKIYENNPGYIKINGERYPAYSIDNDVIEIGEEVIIKDIHGLKFYVIKKKLNEVYL